MEALAAAAVNHPPVALSYDLRRPASSTCRQLSPGFLISLLIRILQTGGQVSGLLPASNQYF